MPLCRNAYGHCACINVILYAQTTDCPRHVCSWALNFGIFCIQTAKLMKRKKDRETGSTHHLTFSTLFMREDRIIQIGKRFFLLCCQTYSISRNMFVYLAIANETDPTRMAKHKLQLFYQQNIGRTTSAHLRISETIFFILQTDYSFLLFILT